MTGTNPQPETPSAHLQGKVPFALSPSTASAVDALAAHPKAFGAPPRGFKSVAAALPDDFWKKLEDAAGAFGVVILKQLLMYIPLGGMIPGATNLAAALPPQFWTMLAGLGPLAVDYLRDFLAGHPAPSPA